MILMIDNYDSFTFNIVQYIKILGYDIETIRNDKVSEEIIKELNPSCIIISPGPKDPIHAGKCLNIMDKFKGIIPILGICLGHQCIGHLFGGKVVQAKTLMHGKNSIIKSLKKGIFKEFSKESFSATRYHSLVVEKETLPDCLEITCQTSDGEIMGLRHKSYNIEGVQFHPEAILTEDGLEMFRIFLNNINIKNEKKKNIAQKEPTIAPNEKNCSNKLIIYQLAEKIGYNGSLFDLYERLYNSSGQFNKSVIFDSANGPKKDLNFSLIGLDPQVSIQLKNRRISITGKNKYFVNFIKSCLSERYSSEGNELNIKNDRFSDVFNTIRKLIRVDCYHLYSFDFSTAFIGYFSYEYLHYLEDIPKNANDPLNFPDVELTFYSTLIVQNKKSSDVFIIKNDTDGLSTASEIKSIIYQKNGLNINNISATVHIEDVAPESVLNITKEKYIENVIKSKDYITSGDIFQVQLGVRERIHENIIPLELYKELRIKNPSPYMVFMNNGSFHVISNSPELQFSVINKKATIRPIAGTSKGKGHDETSKEKIYHEFKKDQKENAEHLMLVDLARNDIGRMATSGSVNVEDLLSVEEYSNVFHLTSTVTGEIDNNFDSMELFEATFPAGTLTGAPKIRAMEIISELETEVRGLYGGAIGVFDLNGNISSSIIIRTIIYDGHDIYLQASAGTVADSAPINEWNEINFKLDTLRNTLNRHIAIHKYKYKLKNA